MPEGNGLAGMVAGAIINSIQNPKRRGTKYLVMAGLIMGFSWMMATWLMLRAQRENNENE